ncbi:hypothetical protein D3C79_976520 [compost metagenome]
MLNVVGAAWRPVISQPSSRPSPEASLSRTGSSFLGEPSIIISLYLAWASSQYFQAD